MNRQHGRGRWCARIAGVGMALTLAGAAGGQVSFTPLGDLAGGDPYSRSAAVSANGQVIAGASASTLSNFSDDAFRFVRPSGPMSTLTVTAANNDLPGGNYRSSAAGVNADGTVIVGASAYNGVRTHAFAWRASAPDVLTDLGNIAGQAPALPATNDISAASAVSDDGLVIVGRGVRSTTLMSEACVWINGGPGQGLGDLAGGSALSVALGVSGNGQVVVGQGQSASGPEAFRWTAIGGLVGLGDDPGGAFASGAADANANGTVIVGYCTTAAGLEAARWSGISPTTLRAVGDLPGGPMSAEATAVSADGLVIVGSSLAGRQVEVAPGFSVDVSDAFVWTPRNGMRKLADVLGAAVPAGWTLDLADGVSAEGTVIAGTGTNPQGESEAFVAVIGRYCVADANDSGAVTVQDIFDFLAEYFASSPRADVNVDGAVSVQDIFDFLAAYFAGC